MVYRNYHQLAGSARGLRDFPPRKCSQDYGAPDQCCNRGLPCLPDSEQEPEVSGLRNSRVTSPRTSRFYRQPTSSHK